MHLHPCHVALSCKGVQTYVPVCRIDDECRLKGALHLFMLYTGVRLKDKYLILQTHNPKRMFKLARGEEGGREESTHDDDKQGVFLQMVKAVSRLPVPCCFSRAHLTCIRTHR